MRVYILINSGLDDNLPSKFANIKIKTTSLGSKFSQQIVGIGKLRFQPTIGRAGP